MNYLKRSNIKFSTLILTLYIAFLPISTALAGFITSSSIQSLVAVGFIMVSFIEILITRKIDFNKKLIPVYIYFVFMLSTGFWNRAFALDWYSMQFAVTFLIIVCVSIRSYSDLELKLIGCALYCSILVALISALCFSFFHGGRMYVEIFSLMDPNDFSSGLAIAFALCMTELLKKKRIILNIICLLIVLGIVYLSGSRGGLLTMLCIILVWVLSIKGKAKYIVLGAMAASVAVFLFCAEYGIGPSQISRFSVSALISGGGTGRSEIWKAAMEFFVTQSPLRMLFGNGLGSFADTVNYVAPGNDFTYESHNMYINTLIEGGVIGLALLIACFTSLYAFAFKRKNLLGILALTGFLITGISLDTQVYRTFAIAAVAALIWHEIDLTFPEFRKKKTPEKGPADMRPQPDKR